MDVKRYPLETRLIQHRLCVVNIRADSDEWK